MMGKNISEVRQAFLVDRSVIQTTENLGNFISG